MKKLFCRLFGHRYRLLRQVTPTVRELYCSRCCAQFAMHDTQQVVLPLDDELRRVNDDMNRDWLAHKAFVG